MSFLILKGHDQVFILSGLCKNFISMTAISLLMPSLGLWNSRPKAFGVKVAKSQKEFHFGSNLQKKANHYPTKVLKIVTTLTSLIKG